MSTPNPTAPTSAQALSLLEILKNDALIAFAPALVTFLTNVQKNPSPIAAVASWAQLQGDIIGALPGAEQSLIAQVDAVLLTKLQALLNTAKSQAGIS